MPRRDMHLSGRKKQAKKRETNTKEKITDPHLIAKRNWEELLPGDKKILFAAFPRDDKTNVRRVMIRVHSQ